MECLSHKKKPEVDKCFNTVATHCLHNRSKLNRTYLLEKIFTVHISVKTCTKSNHSIPNWRLLHCASPEAGRSVSDCPAALRQLPHVRRSARQDCRRPCSALSVQLFTSQQSEPPLCLHPLQKWPPVRLTHPPAYPARYPLASGRRERRAPCHRSSAD